MNVHQGEVIDNLLKEYKEKKQKNTIHQENTAQFALVQQKRRSHKTSSFLIAYYSAESKTFSKFVSVTSST